MKSSPQGMTVYNRDEISRARYLADRLAAAVAVGRVTRNDRASMRLDEAEELLQLLEDSLRTIREVHRV